MTMRVGSLFTGIGGLDLGLERAGLTIAWQCEIDEHCRRVLARHWPDVQCYEDIRDLRGDDVPTVDVLVGGFPCQDLSSAGRRAGLDGERSGLWWEFARMVDECRPTWVVIENVPGLLSSNRGRDMGTVLGTLGDMGYGWAYRVLDAQWFGLAQRRARVFVVGCAGDRTGAAQVLLEPESRTWNPRPCRAPRPEAAETPDARAVDGGGPDTGDACAGALIPSTAYALRAQGDRVNDPDLITLVPVAFAYQAVEVDTTLTSDRTPPVTSSQRLAVHTSVTVRRLTPLECERIQGFPDGWTAGDYDTHRYRMLGNAVAVPVAEWIGRRIYRTDDHQRRS